MKSRSTLSVALFSLIALLATAGRAPGQDETKEEPKPKQASPRQQVWQTPVPRVPAGIRELMQDRDYAAAVTAIDKALAARPAAGPAKKDGEQPQEQPEKKTATDIDYDYLLYLKGRALHLQDNYDDAIATYTQLEKDFADSPWARRARFGKAVSFARKGDYLNAELIFKKEVEFLLSTDRKQQIADIYLEFADAYFAPPKEDLQKKPDYKKALDFYQKALQVAPRSEKRIDVELQVAQCFQKMDQFAEAAQRYQQFIKDHPDSPQVVEAKFLLGQSQFKNGQLVEARRTWQDLLADHGDDASPRIPEAMFNIASTHRVPTPGDDEQLSLGVAALEKFVEKYPQHKLASKAHLQIAQSYMHRGRFDDAVSSLKRFLAEKRFAKTDEAPFAQNTLGRAYQRQKKFDLALAAWREFLSQYPTHSAWNEAQRAVLDTEYLIGADHLAEKRYAEARKTWSAFLLKYPLDGRAPQILYQFGVMHFHEDQFEQAIADWRRLVSKYPGTQPASHAQFMIAVVTEEKLGQLAAALKEYKKVTWGNFQSPAQRRIAALTAKAMSIQTVRIFRSDETPQIKLTTRNIDEVTVEAYVVDLETYFRKMHLARGVEGLDLDLIDPDSKFVFEVPKYAEYQKLESTIDVPLPKGKAGVMAIAISSKTLTATTLIVQSDLDLISKSSRDELFVFTQNMRTGEAWADAQLLVSDGKRVFAQAATGDDGVLQKTFDELKQASDIRVFAIADGHVASNIVNLSGVGIAQGLEDKGYIYTDRPAYRAGQMVHVRGIIRRVAGDTYTVQKDKKFNVTVYDNRSRPLHEAAVALSDFGSFHTHFMLPPTSPQGTYRVVVAEETNRSTDMQTYQGAFIVHEYKLEPVQLLVETDRTIFYRGEEITGKIVAKYYYGAPLADREIRYQLAGDRTYTAKTDKNGEVQFTLPTRDYRESRVLPLVVTLPERNLQTTRNFVLATQGFSIQLSTVRSVYLAGDTFEIELKTLDAEGEPVARKLNLKVLKQTKVNGRVGESLVDQHELTSDDKQGSVRHTLKLDEGGTYILRAEGTDRFDNPITGTASVVISDEDDATRLRILADRHTFKVGETADVTLHWREQPALALITWQGAKILDYKILKLKGGENRLPIPMTARLAPNFELSVAVMLDVRRQPNNGDQIADEKDNDTLPRRFHSAASWFSVERRLAVSVDVRHDGKPVGEDAVPPGAELQVEISTTDPLGKPVSAELSLAMIEQALLNRFAPQVSDIQTFFRGTNRQSAVRTTSSIEFAYKPTTQRINQRLLNEEERLELAREELERLATERPEVTSNDRGRTAWGVVTSGPAATTDSAYDMPADQIVNAGTAVGGVYANGFVPARPNTGGAQQGQQPFRNGQGGGRWVQGAEQTAEDINQGDAQIAYPDAKVWKELNAQHGRNTDSRYDKLLVVGERHHHADGTTVQLEHRRNQLIRDLSNAEAVLKAFALTKDYSRIAGPISIVRNGEQITQNIQPYNWDAEQVAQLKRQLSAPGTIVLPRGPQETGYWNPAIVTDDKGKATITLTSPDRSTAWRLTAKGVTTDTLAGEATADVVARKDLFGELKLPLAFTDGDQAQITVSIHNSLDKLPDGQDSVEATLKTTIGERSQTETKKVTFDAAGIKQLVFPATLTRSDDKQDSAVDDQVTFELTVRCGKLTDVVRRTLPIKPHGMPVFATVSGSAEGDATAQISPPTKMALNDPRLQILIGPTVEQSLLDIVLGPPPVCQLDVGRLATGLDAATSDLMAAIAVQKLLAGTRDQQSPQAESLDSRIRSSISLLVSSQLDDGAWSWTGRGGAANRYTSARAIWALSLARKAGYTVPDEAMNRGAKYLQSQVATTASEDYESKAVLIHALAAAGREDFRVANRLYRSRPSLSSAGLVYLALTFAEMDRRATANELLELLGQRNLDAAPLRRADLKGSLPWNCAGTELRALYALALQLAAEPAAAAVNGETLKLVNWLMAHRTGHRWSPEKATGPAALAVCQWYSKTRFDGEHYKLAIFVNDVRVKQLDVQADSETQTIDVAADMLKDVNKKDVRQRVHFQITGRGRFTYQCILSGFVAADQLADTTGDWRVERHYEPAALEFDGRPVGRGFGVLQGNYKTFRNPLTQLPVGRRGRVELRVSRHNIPSGTPQEHLEYLVVTEPLPSGTSVVENSISGGFDRYEISPGAITFYIGSRPSISTIRYELHGYLPGAYRCGPSVVRDAYRADRIAVSKPKSLDVLPPGAETKDKYRLTPQELWELGLKNFEAGNMKEAGRHLNALFANWNLKPEIYKRSAKMLLDIHLKTGPAHKVVYYFEILKERWKDLSIPFDKVVQVGHAYHEMGEYESAYIVFRVVAEGSFGRESGVAGFLQGQGEFIRSVDVMNDLLRQYPPESYLASATYALAQRVYAKAPEAAQDPKLREKKINRIDLVRQSLAMLNDFLTAYPDDPAADQASFSVASGLLELEAYDRAIAACQKFARRYPESTWLDSYWYVIGFCHFARGQHDEALKMCQKVAEAKRTDRQTGREVEARNKWRAIYIMGQVYHSLGRAAEAIKEYERVKDRFVDALQAIDFFARKAIELPEVTTLRPGDKPEVTLTYRNVPACDVKVYRIDLMKFSLLKRNLAQITKINLAGIRPLHEETIALGDGKDYGDREHTLTLPIKDEGAYLIVGRGENLHTSGLVLLTPLAVEIQEEASSGRVRTTVKDATKDSYIADVHVKVIGSSNQDFVSGDTDLRGVFVADGIQGTSTVIARADTGRYAFFRGEQHLGPRPAQQEAAAQQQSQQRLADPSAAPQGKASKGGGKRQLLEQIFEDNDALNVEQKEELQKIYEGGKDAVELEKF